MSSKRLQGKRIAFLATNGFEQVELTRPWDAIKEAGAAVELVSLKTGKIQGMNHDQKAEAFPVDNPLQCVGVYRSQLEVLTPHSGSLSTSSVCERQWHTIGN